MYINHYVLIEKLHVFLGKRDSKFLCRRCLSSFTNENTLLKHKQKCEQQEITSIKTPNESQVYRKKYFHKVEIFVRIYADFEAENQIDKSNEGDRTTNIFKKNPVCSGYCIVSELNDVLHSGNYNSPLGYNNVDWFVDGVIQLENKMNLYFKTLTKILH